MDLQSWMHPPPTGATAGKTKKAGILLSFAKLEITEITMHLDEYLNRGFRDERTKNFNVKKTSSTVIELGVTT
jgi:hypothetical protein